MKRLLGILLLILMVAQAPVSYLLVMKAERVHHQFAKVNMRRRGDTTEKLEIITFHKDDDINWQIKDKEFLLKGKLYDIEVVQLKGDSLHMLCKHDKKEEQMFAHYQTQARRHSRSGKYRLVAQANALKYASGLYQFYYSPAAPLLSWLSEGYLAHHSPFIEVLSPPPQV